MTQALIQPTQSPVQPDDIYLRLRKQRNRVAEIDLQVKQLTQEREQLMHSCIDMAQTIEHEGITSQRFVLRGCKTSKRRTVDVQALREKHPDIYSAANPYVDEKVICEILQVAKPGYDLQAMVEEMRPDIYHAAAKLKIGDVEKAAGKNGMLHLENVGIVKVNLYVSGEPEVIPRAIAEAKPRAKLIETEGDEEE